MKARKMVPSEHDEQVVVVRWFDLCFPQLAGLLFAIPNGGHRHIAVAGKLKAEGVRPGVSDLMLPIARYGFHGLFIEMKSLKGSPSSSQLEFMERVTEQGYLAACCKGADAAMDTIKSYLM
jgi:hypothetical protein